MIPGTQKKPASKAEKPPEETPDVEIGDMIYFRHKHLGPLVGKVKSRGQHGCHVDAGKPARRHKMLWEDYIGHKTRLRPEYKIVDEGEDGLLAEEDTGRRRFIHDPDMRPGDMVAKSAPMVLLLGNGSLMMKAATAAARPGLSLQDVTDKSGNRTKRWKRTAADAPKTKRKAAPDDAGAARGFGTHDIGRGDAVEFNTGDFKGKGKVVGEPGKKGAHVRDESGKVHTVHWHEITKLAGDKPGAKGEKSPQAAGAGTPRVLGEQKPIDAGKFNAMEYAKSHDDGAATADAIMAQFPASVRKKAVKAVERLKQLESTIDKHKRGDGYEAEREKLHERIYSEVLSPERIAAATPAPGKKPTFVMLGGRGGSGKGGFKGRVYNEEDSIVLDPDKIKGMLPEYEGWNAAQVHAESSDIMDRLVEQVRDLGVNVVLDVTMKTAGTALERVKAFKSAGYETQAHYMHLPRQEAAKRAVSRFVGKTGRFVPPEVVLENKGNEANFDQVRQHVDGWSFWDNNVPEKTDPVLISQSGKSAAGKEIAEKGDLKPAAKEGT